MRLHRLISRISVSLCLSSMLVLGNLAYSQEADIAKYPQRPITYIISVLPGVPADLACRLIVKEAEKSLGQPIVLLNKAGGSGTLGPSTIAASKPDGYTLGFVGQGPAFAVPLLEKVAYHPVKDLNYIMQFGINNFGVYVRADSPFKTWQDLIAYARKNPQKATYGTTGVTSLHNIVTEQIALKEKVEFSLMPFKSGSESQAAILGGHIHFAVGDLPYPLVEAGKIRVLLVFKDKRDPLDPDTPAFSDFGYDTPFPTMLNVVGPKALPEGIVKKIDQAFHNAMKAPAFIKGMQMLHIPPFYRSSRELNEYVAQNYALFSRIFKEKGLIK